VYDELAFDGPHRATKASIAGATRSVFVIDEQPSTQRRIEGMSIHRTQILALAVAIAASPSRALAQPAPAIPGRCADGSQEQVFAGGLVGCAGAVSFADRTTLCAPGFRTASSAEWVALHGSVAPTHDYWTNDGLRYLGSGTAACSVSPETGFSCGATPMRVCTATGSDPEGNVCNWQHCGLESTTPDQFFGGCAGNTTAGALCIACDAGREHRGLAGRGGHDGRARL
jgi:hypothetical protein